MTSTDRMVPGRIMSVVVIVAVVLFLLLLHVHYTGKPVITITRTRSSNVSCHMAGAPVAPNTVIEVKPGTSTSTVPSTEVKPGTSADSTTLPAGYNPTKCTDKNRPYWDPEMNKCVECFESSFHCLSGYQRCYRGDCVIKNSPQCANYPIGALGNLLVPSS